MLFALLLLSIVLCASLICLGHGWLPFANPYRAFRAFLLGATLLVTVNIFIGLALFLQIVALPAGGLEALFCVVNGILVLYTGWLFVCSGG